MTLNQNSLENEVAFIEKMACTDLLSRLSWLTLEPLNIVVVSATNSETQVDLKLRYQTAEIIQITADQLHTLPPQSVDLIIANWIFPWKANAKELLKTCQHILRTDGVLVMNELGLDTIREWRAHLPFDAPPFFVDMHDVGDALVKAGFQEPVLDTQEYLLKYASAEKMQTELLASGLISASVANNLIDNLPKSESHWLVTLEIINAHAFAASNTSNKEATFSVAALKAELQKKKDA